MVIINSKKTQHFTSSSKMQFYLLTKFAQKFTNNNYEKTSRFDYYHFQMLQGFFHCFGSMCRRKWHAFMLWLEV